MLSDLAPLFIGLLATYFGLGFAGAMIALAATPSYKREWRWIIFGSFLVTIMGPFGLIFGLAVKNLHDPEPDRIRRVGRRTPGKGEGRKGDHL